MAENQIPVVLARFSGLTANDKRGIQKNVQQPLKYSIFLTTERAKKHLPDGPE